MPRAATGRVKVAWCFRSVNDDDDWLVMNEETRMRKIVAPTNRTVAGSRQRRTQQTAKDIPRACHRRLDDANLP